MADGSQNRFVSKGFEGVTLVAGERRGKPLLQGRSARLAAQRNQVIPADHAVTKKSLIKTVAESTAMTPYDAARVVESVLENIAVALKNGREVRLIGFGTFSLSKDQAPAKSRMGPAYQKKSKLVAEPTFKAGKALKDAVN